MSKASITKLNRQVNLISALMANPSGVTHTELMTIEGYDDDAQEKSRRRRFERDRVELCDHGLPIRTKDDSHGHMIYYIDRSKCLLPHVYLTDEQRLLLYQIVRGFVESGAHDTLTRRLSMALMKLNSGADGLSNAPDKGHIQRAVLGTHGDPKSVRKLETAIMERRRAKFQYRDASGKKSKREVEPWGIIRRQGNVYVIGHDVAKKDRRCFLASRIDGNVQLSQRADQYEPPSDFDPSASMSLLPFGSGANSFKGVEIRFAATIAFIVQNELEGTYEIVEHRDGTIDVKIPEAWPFELLRFLSEFAGHWEIRKPKALREFVVAVLSQQGRP